VWESRLAQLGVAQYRVNCSSLEVETPLESKLEVVRLLLNDQGIEDLDLLPPSLESLYVHYNHTPLAESAHA
jgi:Cu-processing system ATP-binding protein